MSEWESQQDALSRIVGSKISFMQFILDYLIIGFSENGAMSVFVWPELHISGSVFRIGDSRYRDELCKFIGCDVVEASINLDDIIKIECGDQSILLINLKGIDQDMDRAIITAPKHFIYSF